MGKPDPAAADAAIALLAGSFAGTGTSAALALRGDYNLSLAGFGTATVALQRSFDGGVTWRALAAAQTLLTALLVWLVRNTD